MSIGRSEFGFAERDRQILQLLQPHLVQAYWNAAEVTRLHAEAMVCREAVEAAGAAVAMIDERGAIVACSTRARQLMQAYCRPWRRLSRLPDGVARWVREQRQAPGELRERLPLILTGEQTRLTIRLAWDRAGIGSLLLLNEESPRPASGAAHPAVLNLPPRQRELLQHLLAGDSEKEAAAKMRLSRNTIHNYVTALYRRLDVSSRAELMARFVR